MKKILALLLITSCVAIAQRKHHKHGGKHHVLVGRVLDTSGEPLMGATILVDDSKYVAIANSKGMYFIHDVALGAHEVKASFMGYALQRKKVDIKENKTQCNFQLKEDSESLSEVELSAKSQKTEIETKGFAVNVVETKEASLRNVQTNELLNTTVGVKLRQNGGLGSSVEYSLNGLSGNSVRIFIDGIPISMYGSSFSLNSIPPAMIENIEVYKGVVPAHLSDDALGGAINIVLKKGNKNNLNASVSYGSFNTFQANVSGLYRFKKTGFTVKASGFHNYSDNDYEVWGRNVARLNPNSSLTPITAKRFNDAYRSTGGMIQAGFTDVKWADQFFIGITGSDDYKEIQHGAFLTHIPYYGRFMESDAVLASLDYRKKDLFIKGLDVDFNGLIGERNRVVNDTVPWIYTWEGVKWEDGQNNNEPKKYADGAQQGAPTLLNINRKVSSIRTGISYKINKHHKVLLNHMYSGLDREDSDEMVSLLENTFQQTSDLYKNITSLSYELNAFEEKLKVNLFGKHYRQKILNTKPEFNDDETEVIDKVDEGDINYNGYGVATSYSIFKNIVLLASAEKAVRLPIENEIFGDAGENIVGNFDLKPEISMNYNFGFRLGKFHMHKHGVSVSTNLFSRKIQDLIGLPANADSAWENNELVQHSNFDEETTSQGVEAQFNYTYNNNLGFNFNFSKLSLKTKNRSGLTIDVPNTPLFTMNGALRYSIKNFIQKNARLNLFYNVYFTDDFSYKAAEGKDNGGLEFFEIPQQTSHDFGLSYAFPKENLSLSFDVKNIFNQAIYDNLSVQKPGRAFYLKLNYTINKL